jgi:hypothetical protein
LWYLAEILLAEIKTARRRTYICESCNVLFQAPTAAEAYDKAMEWGRARAAAEPRAMDLLGVCHLTTIDDEPGDGIEISGRFFRKRDVWDQAHRMVPPPEKLNAIFWERNQDTPIGELLDKKGVRLLRQVIRRHHDD